MGAQRIGPFDAKADLPEPVGQPLESLPGKAAGLVVALDHAQDDVHVVDADLLHEPEIDIVLALHPIGVDAGSDTDPRPFRRRSFLFRGGL